MGFGIEAVFFSLALADATRRRNDSIAALHQEAEGRVKELETRQREVTQLNDELRHQVAERSRELGEALSTVDAAATSPVEVGERFHGRYRVLRVLGEGGMGVVYEVERVTDAQRFALKVISGAQSGVNAARFLREAEIGARVRHPNVVSIVDVGVERGAPFLVMELVTGQPLEEMRARFGDVAWAMPILGQVLEGLAALHDAGVVHRDLKPGNILVGGAAKISDFGISRLGAPTTSAVNVEGATVDASASRKDLTGTGAFLGTPNYMAPETARGGRDVGVASDMFAFGIIAYELLTSRSPFAMPPVVLAMAGQPIPPPSPLDATVPERLSALVLACLSIDPSARPSARDAARVTG
jgi:serine/threonine-protein kinase